MSRRRSSDIPPPLDDDLEDVHVALSAATTLWRRGEQSEALKWLRRAAGAAAERDEDERAVQLFKAAADVASELDADKARQLSHRSRETITGGSYPEAAAKSSAPSELLASELDFDDTEDTVIRPETRVRRALMAIDPDYARRTAYSDEDDEEEEGSLAVAAERHSAPTAPSAQARRPSPPSHALSPPPLPRPTDEPARRPRPVSPPPAAKPKDVRSHTMHSPPPQPRRLTAAQSNRARRTTLGGRPRTLAKPDSGRFVARRVPGSAAARGRQPVRRPHKDSTTPPGGIKVAPRSTARPPASEDDSLAVTQKRPAAADALAADAAADAMVANVMAADIRGRPAAPQPPPGMLTALRVAVRSDREGEPHLAFLGTAEAPLAGSATALLVAPTEADARLLAEIFQAAQQAAKKRGKS